MSLPKRQTASHTGSATQHLADVQATTRAGGPQCTWPLACYSYACDGKMSEMCTGITSIGPAEKASTVLKAATSPAVTKNTAILKGDFRANKPMRFRYTSCKDAAALPLMPCQSIDGVPTGVPTCNSLEHVPWCWVPLPDCCGSCRCQMSTLLCTSSTPGLQHDFAYLVGGDMLADIE